MGTTRTRRPLVAIRVGVALAIVGVLVVLVAARIAETTKPAAIGADANTDLLSDGATGTTVDSVGATKHRGHSGPVLVIGDSLTVGSSEAGLVKLLRADGWRPEVIAETGQAPKWGIDRIASRTTVPPLVIVELGTNPSAAPGTFAVDVKTMVSALERRGAERIVWLTPVHADGLRYLPKVELLQNVAKTDPKLILADWASIALAHETWFRSDGLHYSSDGFKVLAQFIADTADTNDPR
jgi:lysophospholipase L1-like esterase